MSVQTTEPRAPLLWVNTIERALGILADAGLCLQDAVQTYEQWQHVKPLKKVAAIGRVMQGVNALTGKQHSASSAEAVVEGDEEYAAYLGRGTTLTLLRMQCETAYTIAKIRAEYAARAGL